LINNAYDYLFYESKQPNVWQTERGWCIKKENLQLFFNEDLKNYGFNDAEIADFTEYWIPRLNESQFYNIYPQESTIINNVIQLNISQTPDNVLRLFYFIHKSNVEQEINQPSFPQSFKREGFVLAEWGVILD